MQVKQIKFDYEVINFTDVFEKYGSELTSNYRYSLFMTDIIRNVTPHIIYDGKKFYILYNLNDLIDNLENDGEELDYIQNQINNFKKFRNDCKLLSDINNIWLDFGHWLNIVDVIERL